MLVQEDDPIATRHGRSSIPLSTAVFLRISRSFFPCAGLDSGVSLNGETDAGVCVDSGEWELEGDDEVVLRGTDE